MAKKQRKLARQASKQPAEPDAGSVMLANAQAARRLGVAEATLNNMRSRGVGPPYVKIGARVLYPSSALERYIEDHTVTPGAA